MGTPLPPCTSKGTNGNGQTIYDWDSNGNPVTSCSPSPADNLIWWIQNHPGLAAAGAVGLVLLLKAL